MSASEGGLFWKPAAAGSLRGDSRNEEDVAMTASFVQSRAPLAQQRMMLPIYGHKKQILYAVENFNVVVIVGETGSGESNLNAYERNDNYEHGAIENYFSAIMK